MNVIRSLFWRWARGDDGRADFRYVGKHGLTQTCIRAITSVIQAEGLPDEVVVISCHDHYGAHHALLLVGSALQDDTIVEKGFASGHGGEGAKGLSRIVSMFEALKVNIFEVSVEQGFMDRLERHCLTDDDADILHQPSRRREGAHRYVLDRDWQKPPRFEGKWPIPLGLLDRRLMPTVINVLKDDTRWAVELSAAYGLLEHTIRQKARSINPNHRDGGAGELFEKVFGNNPILTWNEPPNEVKGRHMLFTGAFKAFRNQRAHGAAPDDPRREMEELFLLNLLFSLEAETIPVPQSSQSGANHSCP